MNQTILITGAAVRVGREIALSFAKAGNKILIHYHHSKKEAEKLAQEIKKNKAEVFLYRANFLNEQEIKNFCKKIQTEHARIDIIIHNASLFHPLSKMQQSESWLHFYQMHVFAPYLITSLLKNKLNKKRAHVIFMSQAPQNDISERMIPYFCSKEAQNLMSLSLAKSLAPHILVNSVSPAFVLGGKNLKKEEKKLIQKTYTKKWANLKELTSFIQLICSSQTLSGQNLSWGSPLL